MSVINQMLRDLDKRTASAQERSGLPPRLRTLPPEKQVQSRSNLHMLAIGLGAGILISVVTLVAVDQLRTHPQVTPPTEHAVTPAPTLPPAAVAPEAPPVVTPPVIAPPAPPVPPAPPAATPLADTPPPVQPPPRTKPAAPAPKPPPPAAKTIPKSPAPAVAGTPADVPVSAPPAVDGQIDKRNKGSAAQELAESGYLKAMQAVKNGDHDMAQALFRHALQLDPSHAKARQGYLSVLVSARRLDEARQVAEDGLALNPMQSNWAVILARLQFEQGDLPTAVATLERFAGHALHDADYQGLFAYLLQKQARPAEAAARFRTALQVRPNEGRWWFGLGLALEQTNQPAEAREAYGKARETGNLPADMATLVEQKLR